MFTLEHSSLSCRWGMFPRRMITRPDACPPGIHIIANIIIITITICVIIIFKFWNISTILLILLLLAATTIHVWIFATVNMIRNRVCCLLNEIFWNTFAQMYKMKLALSGFIVRSFIIWLKMRESNHYWTIFLLHCSQRLRLNLNFYISNFASAFMSTDTFSSTDPITKKTKEENYKGHNKID